MHNSLKYIILLLLFYTVSSKHDKNQILNPIPMWNNNDPVTVSYLVAPLFKKEYGDLMRNLNAFHAGIMLTNDKTNEKIVLDYNAIDVVDAVFPRMNPTTKSIIWEERAAVSVAFKYDASYWDPPIALLKTNGHIVNDFLCWAPNYNFTTSNYELIAVHDVEQSLNFNVDHPLIPASSCIDFVWRSLQVLRSMGAKPLTPDLKHVERNVIFYSTDRPPVLVQDKGEEHDRIYDFYQALTTELHANSTWDEAWKKLSILFNDEFYVHHNHQYYRVHLAGDRAQFVFSYVDLPFPLENHKYDRIQSGRCRSRNYTGLTIISLVVTFLVVGAAGALITLGISLGMVLYRKRTQRDSFSTYNTINE